MEELWKDMLLASTTPAALQYYSPVAASYYRDCAAYLHQDYLQPPRTPLTPHTALNTLHYSSLELAYLGSSGVVSGRTRVPPSNSTSSSDDSLIHLPVDPFPSSNSRRRAAPVQASASAAGSGDRRLRRMIKNRELAARSRARKQAYANELELELAKLRRENTMLIKREQDLHARLALAAQAPDRSTLRRRCRSTPAP